MPFAYGAIISSDLKKELRQKQCTINIMHAMLSGKKSTICNLHSLNELHSPHSKKYFITRIKHNTYKIEW